MHPPRAVVTGAFGNIGAAAARVLLEQGWQVSTLTNRPPAAGDDPRIERHVLRFDREHLLHALDGADAFVNTYWIRFPHGGTEFSDAIDRSALLFDAARDAGVGRIVHVSVSNPSLDSPLAYYAGKARVEELLRAAGPSWGIVRPTLVVGPRDVLSGNIAWFVRRVPVIAVPRGGGHRLQPVHVEDVGALVASLADSHAPAVVDAAGPDVLAFEDYVRLIAGAVGRRVRLVPTPPAVMLAALRLTGLALRDTILTPEELEGLRRELLVSRSDATCPTSVVEWLRAEGGVHLGRRYVNDTRTRFR